MPIFVLLSYVPHDQRANVKHTQRFLLFEDMQFLSGGKSGRGLTRYSRILREYQEKMDEFLESQRKDELPAIRRSARERRERVATAIGIADPFPGVWICSSCMSIPLVFLVHEQPEEGNGADDCALCSVLGGNDEINEATRLISKFPTCVSQYLQFLIYLAMLTLVWASSSTSQQRALFPADWLVAEHLPQKP